MNKSFASAAAQPLFHTIALWIGCSSLERLIKIAGDPVLSKYVKSIVCSPVRFINWKDKPAYEARIRDWLVWCKDAGHIDTTLDCAFDKYMSAYRRYVNDQEILDEENQDITALAVTLEKLPNLDSVTVDWLNDHFGSVEIIDAFGIFEAENLFTFDCNYVLRVLFGAMCSKPGRMKHLHLGSSDQLMHTNVRDLSHVVF